MSTKALVVLVNGFEEIEAVTVIDILRRGGVEVVTAALGESLSVKGAHEMVLQADQLFADVESETYQAIILPGGPGTAALQESAALVARLHRQKEEGKLLAAICAAPTVLCEAGVLEPAQHITCYPTCVVDLDRPSANVPVVADGNVITGQAPGSAMLFALVLLKALVGEKIATKVARALVTDVF